METFLWVEKYRPTSIDACILPNSLKDSFSEFVKNKHIPNLILSGGPGIGKTTVAKAMVEGKEYVAVREVAQRDANGNTVFVEKQKRITNWFYTNNGKNWFLEIRYANKALELAEGKTAIAIQSKDKIVGTIEKVIEAVIGKELDTAITKAVRKRNANKQSKN